MLPPIFGPYGSRACVWKYGYQSKVAGSIGQGDEATKIQSIIDGIFTKSAVSIMCVFLIYWMLKKGF